MNAPLFFLRDCLLFVQSYALKLFLLFSLMGRFQTGTGEFPVKNNIRVISSNL